MNSPVINPQDSSNDKRHLIEVRTSLGKGRGIFAKEDIPYETTILAEKPLLWSSDMSDCDTLSRFSLLSPPDQAAYRRLHSFPRARLATIPDLSKEDRHVLEIFDANSFGVGGDGVVYLMGSRFNHSCEPNVAFVTNVDGTKFFLANRDIAKDEELFISYGHHSGDNEKRKAWLKEMWDFECHCSKCV